MHKGVINLSTLISIAFSLASIIHAIYSIHMYICIYVIITSNILANISNFVMHSYRILRHAHILTLHMRKCHSVS